MAALSAVLMTSLGLMLGTAAGATEASRADEPQAERADTDYLCLERARYIYYSDPSYTTAVGEDYCECGRLAEHTGRRTPYVQVLYAEPCDGMARDVTSEVE